MKDGDLLTVREAAERLGVHYQTLRKWADTGKVPAVKLPSKYRRFEPAVIERVRQEMGYEGASSARARGHELLDCVREEDLDETVGFLRQFLAVRGYDVWAGG